MSFSKLDVNQFVKFNSKASSDLLDIYETNLSDEIVKKNEELPNRTIAPSSFRCLRKTWFRLRGTEPDKNQEADLSLDFRARLGDACHVMIQERLSKYLGDDWIIVEDYLRDTNNPHDYNLSLSGYETRVRLEDIPINFAVDGIIKLEGKYYLLELKSSEYSSFTDLVKPKDEHVDQVRCYASLLGLYDVLMIYIDRQYGDMKCFEVNIKQSEVDDVYRKIYEVMKCAEDGIAPEGLPVGDKWCSMCNYSEKCKEYGRFEGDIL